MAKDYFLTRKNELEKEIEKIKFGLERSPEGTVVACKVNNTNRWYHQKKAEDGNFCRKYIGEKDIDLARLLAKKAYWKALLKDRENELKSIKQYLRTRKTTDYQELLGSKSKYRSLLIPGRWDMEEYDRNPSHPENLIVKAPKGELVRSKSEALIANALFDAGIMYRYECRLNLEGLDVYPDFTIKKEADQRILLWEHFGKIDDPEYFDKMIRKIALYIRNGYIPGENLLMTFESKMMPLTVDVVQKMMLDNLM
ncbi:hypothetical protein [Butyrivibrio sp. VCB2006]|uniref:hypothetical protein n=1 Tax=Butyrivibrio sp. VCB2006 TaxID=1280679 RepID=UPI00040FB269|nr:hypothetical protein [Butyrivibrio sp. VCB2006]